MKLALFFTPCPIIPIKRERRFYIRLLNKVKWYYLNAVIIVDLNVLVPLWIGIIRVAEKVIKGGAIIDAVDVIGRTSLHYAAENGKEQLLGIFSW